MNFRIEDGGQEHDLVYLRSEGIFIGWDVSVHLIMLQFLRFELGYFSGGEVKNDDTFDDEDKSSILPLLRLGGSVMIPIARNKNYQ